MISIFSWASSSNSFARPRIEPATRMRSQGGLLKESTANNEAIYSSDHKSYRLIHTYTQKLQF